jgi:hypothetical protein
MSAITVNTMVYKRDAVKRRATGAAAVMRAGVACGVFLLQACNASDSVESNGVGAMKPVNLSLGEATVGTTIESPVRMSVTRADGRPFEGMRVVWTTRDGGSLSAAETFTDGTGVATVRWTLGTLAGPQTLVAQVAGLTPVVFGATATPDKAAVIRFNVEEARLRILGDTIRLQTRVVDQFGNTITSPPALSIEGLGDVVTLNGDRLVARRRGVATVRAGADTATARLSVVVEPGAPLVLSVAPDTVVPGGNIVIDGANFAMLPEFADVTIGGYRATVTRISANRIEAVLPATGIPCRETASEPLKVVVGSATAESRMVLRTATRVSLARGESANMLDADGTRCTEIVAPAGSGRAKYVLAVINTNLTPSTTTGFELRGAGAGALAGKVAVPITTSPEPLRASAARFSAVRAENAFSGNDALPAALTASLDGERNHDEHLDSQRSLRQRYGSPASTWSALRAQKTSRNFEALHMSAMKGDTVVMKAMYNSCSKGADIRARIVYSGARSVVLEDVASPRAGKMDAYFQAIGEEFDRVQYPLLQSRIGDPLAMDAAMGGDGRVTMLFTRYVNDTLPGLTGFVTACNFYPKGTFAASNEDEVFYARVATAGESADDWHRAIRSTVMHESKHLASFAERFVRSTPFEESWLEESTARIAEELYSRTFANGGGWKSNVGFTSVRCEVTRCDERPLMMWKHFSVLHQYMRGVDTLTPIGAAGSGDFTYYASGWSLVRWAADQYATDEGAWLKSLVKGSQLTGLAQLASLSGQSPNEMLADWSLATAVDDLAGFAPKRRQLSLPSWNTADVMSGLAESYPGMFVAAPLKARAMSFGSFSLPVTRLRAFSSSYFTFEGSQVGTQLVELRGEGGVTLPAGTLRVAVVRVE